MLYNLILTSPFKNIVETLLRACIWSRVTLYTAGHLHTAVPHCSHSRAPIVHTAVPRENNEHGCVYLRCTAVCKLPGCVEGHPWWFDAQEHMDGICFSKCNLSSMCRPRIFTHLLGVSSLSNTSIVNDVPFVPDDITMAWNLDVSFKLFKFALNHCIAVSVHCISWFYSGNTWLCVHWQWNTREWCH